MAGQASTSIVIDIDTNKAVSNLNDLSARAEKLYETMSKFGSEKFLEEEYKGLKSGIEALVKSAENAKTTFEKITLFTKMDALVESADKYNAKVREFNSNLNETDKKLEEISSISFKVDNIEFSNRKGIQNQLKSLQDLCEKESKKIKLNISVEDVLPKQIKNVVDNYKKSLKEEIKKQIDSGNFEATIPLLYEYKVASKGFDGRNNQFKEFDEESIKSFSSIKKSELITIYKDMTDDQIKQIQNLWKTSANNLDLSEGIAIVNSKLSEAAGKIKVGSSGANGKGLVVVDNSVADNAGDQIKNLKDKINKEYDNLLNVIDEKGRESIKKAADLSKIIVDYLSQLNTLQPQSVDLEKIAENYNRNVDIEKILYTSGHMLNMPEIIPSEDIEDEKANYNDLISLLEDLKVAKASMLKTDFQSLLEKNKISVTKINDEFKRLNELLVKNNVDFNELNADAKSFQTLIGNVFGEKYILPEYKGTGTGSGTGSGSGDSDYNNSDVEALNDRVNEMSDELSRKDEKIKELEDQVDRLQSSTQNGKGSGSGTGTGGTWPVSGTGVSPEEMNQLKTKLNSIEQTVGELKAKVESLDPQSYSSAIETINTINNNINAISDSISKIPTQSINTDQLSSVNNTLAELKTILDGLGELKQLTNLSSKLDDISTKVNVLHDNLVKLQDIRDLLNEVPTPSTPTVISPGTQETSVPAVVPNVSGQVENEAAEIRAANEHLEEAMVETNTVASQQTEMTENERITKLQEMKNSIEDNIVKFEELHEEIGKVNTKNQFSEIARQMRDLNKEIKNAVILYNELAGDNSLSIFGYNQETNDQIVSDIVKQNENLVASKSKYNELNEAAKRYEEILNKRADKSDYEAQLQRLRALQDEYENIIKLVNEIKSNNQWMTGTANQIKINDVDKKRVYKIGGDLSNLNRQTGIDTYKSYIDAIERANDKFEKYKKDIQNIAKQNITTKSGLQSAATDLYTINSDFGKFLGTYMKAVEKFNLPSELLTEINKIAGKGTTMSFNMDELINSLNDQAKKQKKPRNTLGKKAIDTVAQIQQTVLNVFKDNTVDIPVEVAPEVTEPTDEDLRKIEQEAEAHRNNAAAINEEITANENLSVAERSRLKWRNKALERQAAQSETSNSTSPDSSADTSPTDNTTLSAILTEVKSINGKMSSVNSSSEEVNELSKTIYEWSQAIKIQKESGAEEVERVAVGNSISGRMSNTFVTDEPKRIKSEVGNALIENAQEAIGEVNTFIHSHPEEFAILSYNDFVTTFELWRKGVIDNLKAVAQNDVMSVDFTSFDKSLAESDEFSSMFSAFANETRQISEEISNTKLSEYYQSGSFDKFLKSINSEAFEHYDGLRGVVEAAFAPFYSNNGNELSQTINSGLQTAINQYIDSIINNTSKTPNNIEDFRQGMLSVYDTYINKFISEGSYTNGEMDEYLYDFKDVFDKYIQRMILDIKKLNPDVKFLGEYDIAGDLKETQRRTMEIGREWFGDGFIKLQTIDEYLKENPIKKTSNTISSFSAERQAASKAATAEVAAFTTIDDAVTGLTGDINTKTEAIRAEARVMIEASKQETQAIGRIVSGVIKLKEEIKNIPKISVTGKNTKAEPIKITAEISDEQIAKIRQRVLDAFGEKNPIPIFFKPNVQSIKKQINNGLKDGLEKLTIQSFDFENAAKDMKKTLANAMSDVGLQFDTNKLRLDIKTAVNAARDAAESAGRGNPSITASGKKNAKGGNVDPKKLDRLYASFERDVTSYYNKNTLILRDQEVNDLFSKILNDIKKQPKSKENLDVLYRRFSEAQIAAINKGLDFNADKSDIGTAVINKGYETLISQINKYLETNTKIIGSQFEEEFSKLLTDAKKPALLRTDVDLKQLGAEFARIKNYADEAGLVGNVSKENEEQNKLAKRYFDLGLKMREFRQNNDKFSIDKDLISEFEDIFNKVISSYETRSKEDISDLEKRFSSLKMAIPADLMGSSEKDSIETSIINKSYDKLIDQVRNYLAENTKIVGSKLETEFFNLLNDAKKNIDQRTNADFRQLDAEFARLRQEAGSLGLVGNVSKENTDNNNLDKSYIEFANSMRNYYNTNNKIDQDSNLLEKFNNILNRVTLSTQHSKEELSELKKEFAEFQSSIPLSLMGTFEQEAIQTSSIDKGYENLITQISKYLETNTKIQGSKLEEDFNSLLTNAKKATADRNSVDLRQLDAEFARLKNSVIDAGLSGNVDDEVKKASKLDRGYATLALDMKKFHEENNKFDKNTEWADRFNQLFSNITGSISRSDVELEDFRAQFVNFKNEIPRDLLGSTVTSEFFENLKGYDIDSIAKIFEKQSGQVKSKLLGDKYGFESPKMTRDVSQMLDAQADRLTGLINQDNVSDNDIDGIVQHNKQLNNLISTYQTYSEKRRALQEQISKDGSNAELQQLLQESNVLSNSQVYDAEAMKKWSERYVETINNMKNAQIDAEKEERNNRSTSAQQNQYRTLTKNIEEATATAQRFKEQYAGLLSDGLNAELNQSISDMSARSGISVDLSNSSEITTWNDESKKLLDTWTAIQERIKSSVVASGQAGEVITATMDYSQYTRKATNALSNLNSKYKDKLTDKQSAEFEQRLEAIRNKVKEISDDTSKYTANNVQVIETDIQQLEKLAKDFEVVQNSENKINSLIRTLSNSRNSIERRGSVAQPVVSSIDSEKTALEELKRQGQNLNVGDPAAVQAFVEKLKEADTTVNKLKNDAEQIKISTNATASVSKLDSKFNDLLFKVDKFKRDNSKITSDKGISAQFDGLLRSIQTIEKSDVNFQKLNAQFNQLKATVQGKGLTGRSLGDELKYIAEKIGIKAMLGNSIYRVIGAFRQMVGIVTELDTGMTTLRRVTEATEKQYTQFMKNATASAHELGTAISDVVNATGEFSKLGYNLDEATKLGEAAATYANVGFMDISSSIESMTSVMQGFKLSADEAMSVVDKMDLIGNKFSISSAGIGAALQRSASSLVAAGNDLDKSIALVTAGNTVLQDPESVANGIKVISLRIRGAKTELEEANESTDDLVTSTAKLQAKVKAIAGVDIMTDANNFKDTYTILSQISEKWSDLSDIDQANYSPYVQQCA